MSTPLLREPPVPPAPTESIAAMSPLLLAAEIAVCWTIERTVLDRA